MAERRGLKYVWQTAPRAPDSLIAAVCEVPPAMVQVMYARGLDSADRCRDFLAGVCHDDDDPLLLADLPRAVDRLVAARERGEQVAVFTDYDADGVNAAAVLTTGLRLLGMEPHVRLPNRFRDGYGLSPELVEELAAAGARLIVTADCGSTAHTAAERALALGVDLIVTDHHQCGTDLPPAFAVVNPWRLDCQYPCDHLCGAGVAYKLLQALADRLLPNGRAAMLPLLDLVAVATVADIMPLIGENRQLVSAGLKIMNTAPRPGVRALMQVAGLQPGEVDAAALGFRVAPRVNAAGRLDDPSIAFNLLMAQSDEEAAALAAEVDRLNRERQDLARDFEQRATELVLPQIQAGAAALVCGDDDWPAGIVGLVAGKLAQTFNRPTLVFSRRAGIASGSGRSISGFDLLAALQGCDDLFMRYGGHKAAAGFALQAEQVPALIERFSEIARETLTAEMLQPVLKLDAYLKPRTLSLALTQTLEQLAPFGQSFAPPTFGMKGAQVVDSRTMGKSDAHWRARLSWDGGRPVKAVMWNAGYLAQRFPPGSYLDVAFQPKIDEWNGSTYLQLELLDVASTRPD